MEKEAQMPEWLKRLINKYINKYTEHPEPEAPPRRRQKTVEARLPEQSLLAVAGELEPNSPTWRFIRTWAEDTLTKARIKNDNLNKDATQTAALRGEIKILKELIKLPEPKRGLLLKDEDAD